jgi:single-strand DNA-binding protein
MKGTVNKVMIMGRLGADPDVKATTSGDTMTRMSIATNEVSKNKDTGEKEEHTTWHRVVMFGRIAEIAGQYLKKGSSAYIEGKIRTRQWTGEFGEKHYTTEIVARELQLMGGKHEDHAQPPESHVESSDIAADDNKHHVASEDIKPSTVAQPNQKDLQSDAADDIPF